MIFHGISRAQPVRIVVGAIFISLIALLFDLNPGEGGNRLLTRTR